MCAAAAYWAGIKKIYFASTVEDALEYGNFDDSMIYSELKKPTIWRSIPAEQLLRDEAVAVWRDYQKLPGKVQY
jgi:tRNA(Arg) A34 adenosine deaminase TadA